MSARLAFAPMLPYAEWSGRMTAILLLAAVALPVATGCGREETAGTAGDEPARVVTLVRPERHAVVRRVTLAASIEAFEQAPLHAKVSGYVREIGVDIGDPVREGQTLATLEMPEMEQQHARAESQLAEARAALARVEAEAHLQKIQLARSRALRDRDAITQQDLDHAEALDAKARAAVGLARAKERSAAARVGELDATMQYAHITAPFDGVVTRRFVDHGALVQAATSSNGVSPVVTVARVDKLRVFVDVPEPEVPLVDPGDPAVLVVAALPGREFTGTMTRCAGVLDPGSRTMRAEVDLPNADGLLRPGMYGSLTIDVETRRDALTVPAPAVRRQRDRATVFVVADGRAAARAVVTGVVDGERTEILNGLEGGDAVVVPAVSVSDGLPVTAKETGAGRADAPS